MQTNKMAPSIFSQLIDGMNYYLSRHSCLPRHLSFMVTRRCNSRCLMCGVPQKGGYEMNISEIKKIVQDPFFDGIVGVCLTGGEAFLRKDLSTIISLILDWCPQITFLSILSNGLDPDLMQKRMQEIVPVLNRKKEVHFCVSFSFQSLSNETYHKITGVRNGYDRVMETVKRMSEIKRSFPVEIRLNTVIHPLNYMEVPDLLTKAHTLNLPIRFIPVYISGGFFNNVANKEQLTFQRDQLDFIKKFFSVPRQGISEFSRIYWQDYFRVMDGGKRKAPCILPFHSLAMDADGGLFSCVAPVIYGNARDDRILNILRSPTTRKMKQKLLKDFCPTCSAPCGAEDSIREEKIFRLRHKFLNDINSGKYFSYSSCDRLAVKEGAKV